MTNKMTRKRMRTCEIMRRRRRTYKMNRRVRMMMTTVKITSKRKNKIRTVTIYP